MTRLAHELLTNLCDANMKFQTEPKVVDLDVAVAK